MDTKELGITVDHKKMEKQYSKKQLAELGQLTKNVDEKIK